MSRNASNKTLLLCGGVGVLAIPAVAFIAFYLWATSGQLSPQEFELGALYAADSFNNGAADGEYTVVTYNVGYASGMTNNTANNASESEYDENLQSIIAARQSVQPDFVAFQEIDYGSDRSYHREQLRLIADGLGLRYRAKGYNWDCTYLPFPYWPPSAHYGRMLSGQAIASAFPVTAHAKTTLIKPAERPFYYNAFYLDRIVQRTEVDIEGTTLTLLNVHLEAYMKGTREAQAREVVEIVRQYNDGPLILLGDFNAAPEWVQRQGESINTDADTELRDDTTLAILLADTGLTLAIPEADYADGAAPRHNTFSSANPTAPIDHIFYNSHIERLTARALQDAGTGSDHFPILMTFSIGAQ